MSRPLSAQGIEAEAAAWLARLHGDQGDAARDALDAWLAEDPAHAAAFARAGEVWAILPRAARHGEDEARLRPAPEGQPWLRTVLAVAASMVLGLGVLWWSLGSAGDYVTRPGEQQVATLGDGSRIALNTDTRVDVRFDADRRHITLDRGEAMFATPCASSSALDRWAPPIMRSATIADSRDSTPARKAITSADGKSSLIFSKEIGGRSGQGRPFGSAP